MGCERGRRRPGAFASPPARQVDGADHLRSIQDAEWSRRCAIAPTAGLAQLSALPGKQVGVSLQVERPTLISGHGLADALPALAVAVEIAVRRVPVAGLV